MRMPKWLHGWGRGTVAVRKSLGLATKGILDQGRGGKVQGRVVSFDKVYKVKGTKKIVSKKFYKLAGIRQYSTFFVKNVIGKRTTKLTKKINLKATKKYPYSSHLSLLGIKQISFATEKKTKGTKQYRTDAQIKLSGISANKVLHSYKLQGTKKIKFEHTKSIKATRDIRKILIALGVFGGRDE